jgi:hypothetical protein
MRTVLALLVIGQGIGQVIKVKKALYLQLVKVKRGRYICHIRKTKAVIHRFGVLYNRIGAVQWDSDAI